MESVTKATKVYSLLLRHCTIIGISFPLIYNYYIILFLYFCTRAMKHTERKSIQHIDDDQL